jgi:hypothetical protein
MYSPPPLNRLIQYPHTGHTGYTQADFSVFSGEGEGGGGLGLAAFCVNAVKGTVSRDLPPSVFFANQSSEHVSTPRCAAKRGVFVCLFVKMVIFDSMLYNKII